MGRSSTRSLDDRRHSQLLYSIQSYLGEIQQQTQISFFMLSYYVPRLHGQIVEQRSAIGVPARPNRRLALGDWCSCTALCTAKSLNCAR